MTHTEAKKILDTADGDIAFNAEMDSVQLNGTFRIEELQAMLQLMEYSA